MAKAITIYLGHELPTWDLFWLTSIGTAFDASSGWTFGYLDATNTFTSGSALIRLGSSTYTVAGTFTANATPTTDTGSASDIATLTFAPNAGVLDSLPTGSGWLFVAAQSSTKQRAGRWPVVVEDPTA